MANWQRTLVPPRCFLFLKAHCNKQNITCNVLVSHSYCDGKSLWNCSRISSQRQNVRRLFLLKNSQRCRMMNALLQLLDVLYYHFVGTPQILNIYWNIYCHFRYETVQTVFSVNLNWFWRLTGCGWEKRAKFKNSQLECQPQFLRALLPLRKKMESSGERCPSHR